MEKPWARSIPLVISMARGSIFQCLYQTMDQSRNTARQEESLAENTIQAEDARWRKWEEKEAKSSLKTMVTIQEVEDWWEELCVEHKAQYLVKVQYERIEHSWYKTEETRIKWYLGKPPRGAPDYGVYTLFHSTRRRPTEVETKGVNILKDWWSPVNLGGGSIPDKIKNKTSVGTAYELGSQYCNEFAYQPLGKKKDFEASVYECGLYVTLDQSVAKGRHGGKSVEGAPIHPTHVTELSRLNEYPYEIVLYQRNSEPMTDKNIEKENFCKAGITTAMMEDQKVGPFIIGLATVMEGSRVSRDLRDSRQWNDRCEYRERQFHTCNVPQGIPVSKKLENAGKIHVNYKGPFLNFASCQLMNLEAHFTKRRWQLICEVLGFLKKEGAADQTASKRVWEDPGQTGQNGQRDTNPHDFREQDHLFKQRGCELDADRVREAATMVIAIWEVDSDPTVDMRPEEWSQCWILVNRLLMELHQQAAENYQWHWKTTKPNLHQCIMLRPRLMKRITEFVSVWDRGGGPPTEKVIRMGNLLRDIVMMVRRHMPNDGSLVELETGRS